MSSERENVGRQFISKNLFGGYIDRDFFSKEAT
jgi:hypothetical protein